MNVKHHAKCYVDIEAWSTTGEIQSANTYWIPLVFKRVLVASNTKIKIGLSISTGKERKTHRIIAL